MTPANDILLGDQVIEPDQFVLAALSSVITVISGGRILFVFRSTHVGLLLTPSVPALAWSDCVKFLLIISISCLMACVVKN
jgi:hypothetical protein